MTFAFIFLVFIIIVAVLMFVAALSISIYADMSNSSIKNILNEYITELKCRQKKKYGPEYSLEYKIDKIEKEEDMATVYCVYSEMISKNDIAKERDEIIYMICKNHKWMVVDDKDNNEQTTND